MDFSADSSCLASGCADYAVRVWNVKRAAEDQMLLTEQGQQEGLISVFRTKRTPIFSCQFTRRNLLLTAGPFIPFK